MNTTELKKLAEAMQLTSPQLANMGFDSFAEADRLRHRFRSEAPAAILKLLAINAELVERLQMMVDFMPDPDLDPDKFQAREVRKAIAALAKQKEVNCERPV